MNVSPSVVANIVPPSTATFYIHSPHSDPHTSIRETKLSLARELATFTRIASHKLRKPPIIQIRTSELTRLMYVHENLKFEEIAVKHHPSSNL